MLRGEDRRCVESLSAARAATREELYRRVHYARDLLESCYEQPLVVDDLARAACLSPYHFQRTFREVFGCTVVQALQRRRVQVKCTPDMGPSGH